MKKVMKLLVVLLAVLVFGTAFGAKDASAATDKLLAKYFPNGIEKVKPDTPIVDIDANDTWSIGVVIKQNDDILAMVRDFEACEDYVDFQNNWYDDNILKFYVDYGINAFATTVQFDISIDDGDWQYEKSWDKKEHNNYSEGFCFYEGFGGADDDNTAYFTIMEAGPAADGKLLKKTVKNEQFDLKNHTFKVRYRYCVEYGLLDDYEAGMQFYFTDWSDPRTFGKTTDQNLVIPDELPAPDISNPKRELNNEGKWGGYTSVMTHFSQEVTDAETAIYINTGEREPLVIVVEAAVDDPSEKNFEEGGMANAVWLSDGQRGTTFDGEGSFTEKSRILMRVKVHCDSLDKDSKYDYAVDKVKGLKAKKTKTTSIALTWSKVDGAEFYEIYSGDNKLLGTSKTNSFTVKKLKAGTGYDFKVRAVVDKVFVGLFSDTLQTPTKPAKVKISSAKLAKETLTVNYKKVAGSGYEVQIATDKKFSKDLVKLSVKDAAEVQAVKETLTGKSYFVRVRGYITYGGSTVYGAWSKVKGTK